MIAPTKVVRALTAPSAVARQSMTMAPREAPALARGFSLRLTNEWLPRVLWTVSRTGRPGLVGIALLLGAALFLLTTHFQVAAEVEALRADLAVAQDQARRAGAEHVSPPAAASRALPDRTDMPALLSQLFSEATRAGLAINTATYETEVMKTSGVVRHQIAFPVTGAYPQIREFVDATLATMPAVALSNLVLERNSISRGNVEAQIRLAVYTRSGP